MKNGELFLFQNPGIPGLEFEHIAVVCLEVWERRLILKALERSGGNVPDAARLLGIGRATLYRKIEQHKIER